MVKETPSIGRLLAMVVFGLSCFAILLFLWLSFGGSIPLRPEGYRVKASFPEAATLAAEADVRIAGVNVGKVKTKELEQGAVRTLVEIELDEAYAPIARDSRAILRQKTLLGETYIELAPGDRDGPILEDGGRLPDVYVEPTVELDEIFNAFDEPTREAFQEWVSELSTAIEGGRGQDLNDAFGNLEGFAADGATLLEELDQQEAAVKRVIKNTGVVFGALNEREGALRQLIVNSNETFEATASRDDALAETFRVFPTFLDESRVTLARLERFSNDTRPLVNQLKGPADDLGPTVRDLGDLAPDLEGLFNDLPPLIRAGRVGLPDLERTLRGAEPVFEGLDVFLDELNPILSFANFYQARIAGFISNAGPDISGNNGGERYQTNIALVGPRSFERFEERPDFDRGHAYLQPNSLNRTIALGIYESLDCDHIGGEQPDPDDAQDANPLQRDGERRPPCFVAPPSLYGGDVVDRLGPGGRARNVPPPEGTEGTTPADPDR
jgi:virulence factor Mce-like protein